MKTLLHVGLTFLITFSISQTAASQGLLKDLKNKTQNRIEQKVEERANAKADKAIDRQLDKAEDAIFQDDENSTSTTSAKTKNNSNNSNERIPDLIKKMGVGGDPIPIEPSYSFNKHIQMHLESYNEKGKKISEGEFITHLNNDAQSMGYEFVSGDMTEQGMGLIIIDVKNSATIMLSEEKGEKTGLVYGLGTFYDEEKPQANDDFDLTETPETYLLNPNVEKTGRTKTIVGLKCEEYKYTDEKSVSNVWITKELKMNTKDFFGAVVKTSLYSHGMGWGYMMESTTVNKENGEKSIMEVTKVDKNSNKKVSMSDYQITNLGSFKPNIEN